MKRYKTFSTSLLLVLSVCATTLPVALAEKKQPITPVSDIQAPQEDTGFAMAAVADPTNNNELLLDLKTVVGLTLAQNLDIQISEIQLDQAKSDYIGSFAWLMPSLRGQLFFERFNGSDIFIQETPVDVDRDTFRKRLSAEYQIPLGGKPYFMIKAANALKQSRNFALDNTTQKALLDALTQYYQWQRDASKIQAAEIAIKQAKGLVDLQEKRKDTGYGMQLDVEQAKIQLADRESDKLDVENNHQNSEVILATTLNVPVTTNLETGQDLLTPNNLIENNTSLEDMLAISFEKRPELKDLQQQIKSAKAQYQGSYSDLLPTVGLGGYVGDVGPFSNLRETISRSISINYDLLRNMGVGTIGNIKSLRAKWQQTLLQLQKKNNEIQRSIADAYYDWQYQQKQLSIAQTKVKAAEQAEKIAQARLNTGFGLQLEILKAQADLAQARMDYYEAIYQANVAQLRLLYETGQMTPEKLGAI